MCRWHGVGHRPSDWVRRFLGAISRKPSYDATPLLLFSCKFLVWHGLERHRSLIQASAVQEFEACRVST